MKTNPTILKAFDITLDKNKKNKLPYSVSISDSDELVIFFARRHMAALSELYDMPHNVYYNDILKPWLKTYVGDVDKKWKLTQRDDIFYLDPNDPNFIQKYKNTIKFHFLNEDDREMFLWIIDTNHFVPSERSVEIINSIFETNMKIV